MDLIYILDRVALPSKPHYTTPWKFSGACSVSASSVDPHGGPFVDGSSSLSLQSPGLPQAYRILEAVQRDSLQRAPATDTEHTGMESCFWSANLERQEEERPLLGLAFCTMVAAVSTWRSPNHPTPTQASANALSSPILTAGLLGAST